MRRSRLPPDSRLSESGGSAIPTQTIPAQTVPADGPSERAGTLFVVSLPIGDPEDITLRALRVLRNVRLIVAENARLSRALLAAYAIEAEIVSLGPRHGVPAHAAALTLLNSGQDVALVADCGTPTIVDPGSVLIQAAIEQNIRIAAVPGPTACLAALVLSGLASTPFRFLGFAPTHRAERETFFTELASSRHTSILYESPRYLRSTLSELQRSLGNTTKILVACDITHTTERIFRGTISAAVTEFTDKTPTGAYTLVISGKSSSANS